MHSLYFYWEMLLYELLYGFYLLGYLLSNYVAELTEIVEDWKNY